MLFRSKINSIMKVDNIGAYVIKYMTKEKADARLQGLKAYNCSKGLLRPYEVSSWSNGDEITKMIFDKYNLNEKRPVYFAEYTSEQAGHIIYKQFNFNRIEEFNQNDTKSGYSSTKSSV